MIEISQKENCNIPHGNIRDTNSTKYQRVGKRCPLCDIVEMYRKKSTQILMEEGIQTETVEKVHMPQTETSVPMFLERIKQKSLKHAEQKVRNFKHRQLAVIRLKLEERNKDVLAQKERQLEYDYQLRVSLLKERETQLENRVQSWEQYEQRGALHQKELLQTRMESLDARSEALDKREHDLEKERMRILEEHRRQKDLLDERELQLQLKEEALEREISKEIKRLRLQDEEKLLLQVQENELAAESNRETAAALEREKASVTAVKKELEVWKQKYSEMDVTDYNKISEQNQHLKQDLERLQSNLKQKIKELELLKQKNDTNELELEASCVLRQELSQLRSSAARNRLEFNAEREKFQMKIDELTAANKRLTEDARLREVEILTLQHNLPRPFSSHGDTVTKQLTRLDLSSRDDTRRGRIGVNPQPTSVEMWFKKLERAKKRISALEKESNTMENAYERWKLSSFRGDAIAGILDRQTIASDPLNLRVPTFCPVSPSTTNMPNLTDNQFDPKLVLTEDQAELQYEKEDLKETVPQTGEFQTFKNQGFDKCLGRCPIAAMNSPKTETTIEIDDTENGMANPTSFDPEPLESPQTTPQTCAQTPHMTDQTVHVEANGIPESPREQSIQQESPIDHPHRTASGQPNGSYTGSSNTTTDNAQVDTSFPSEMKEDNMILKDYQTTKEPNGTMGNGYLSHTGDLTHSVIEEQANHKSSSPDLMKQYLQVARGSLSTSRGASSPSEIFEEDATDGFSTADNATNTESDGSTSKRVEGAKGSDQDGASELW